MISTFSDMFTLKNFKLGYVRLSDGTSIILRVAIVDIRPLQTPSPFGVEFNVITVSGISVHPSGSVLNEVKDRPTIEPNKTPSDGWTLVNVTEKQSAYEEVEYLFNEKYTIRAEVEPLMAVKNTKYKSVQEQPIYIVRSARKISWKKVE